MAVNGSVFLAWNGCFGGLAWLFYKWLWMALDFNGFWFLIRMTLFLGDFWLLCFSDSLELLWMTEFRQNSHSISVTHLPFRRSLVNVLFSVQINYDRCKMSFDVFYFWNRLMRQVFQERTSISSCHRLECHERRLSARYEATDTTSSML